MRELILTMIPPAVEQHLQHLQAGAELRARSGYDSLAHSSRICVSTASYPSLQSSVVDDDDVVDVADKLVDDVAELPTANSILVPYHISSS